MVRISNSDRSRLFGKPGNVRKVSYKTPWGPVVQVHESLVSTFDAACQEASRLAWKPRRIDSFNYRRIRDSFSPSLHSWALAWDFFVTGPAETPPGGVWHPNNTVPPQFADCFTKRGFTWGATFSRRADYPHIEWAGGLPGPVQQADKVKPMFNPPFQVTAWCHFKDKKRRVVTAAVDSQGHVFCEPADGYIDAPVGKDYWGNRKAALIEDNKKGGYTITATDGAKYSYPTDK